MTKPDKPDDLKTYRVKLYVTGWVTYELRAKSPDAAVDKARDLYNLNETPDVDKTEADPILHEYKLVAE
jgi:hypothetical protein